MANSNQRLAQALRAATALDTARTQLAQQYLTIQQRYLRALSPADWWNDGVALGVSAKLALAYMSMVENSYSYGVSYANSLLTLANRRVDLSNLRVDQYLPVRYGTDPQMIAYKPFNAYREQAVKTPDVRPETFTEAFTSEDWDTIERYLEEASRVAQTVAEYDSVASSNRGSQDVYEDDPKVLQYMRVIHPELSKSGTCGLCVAAATRLYSKHDLMPLHAHCHCTTAPVIEGEDWLYQMGRDNYNLNHLYAYAGGTSARKLSQIRIAPTEAHNELGSVLTNNKGRVIGVQTWNRPDLQHGREQLTRMHERLRTTIDVIDRVQRTGKSEVFESGGRKFTIKPDTGNTGMLAKSLEWNTQIYQKLSAYLGLSV